MTQSDNIASRNMKALQTMANMEGKSSAQEFLNELIKEAEILGASDIHFEPTQNALKLRMRIDGVLRDAFTVNKKKEATIISCIKVMGGMDITEKRLPQDGRIEVDSDSNSLKVRVASIPQVFGEKIVMRIFSKNQDMLNIESLGFTDENLKKFEYMISRPSGMVLVSGPTGAGKTTTIYAAMNRLKSPTVNIVSIEDPIEYIIEDVNQIQVNHQIDFSFPIILKAILRQDPDIIILGEIRDSETATTATKAAMTGHLLLSTFHANGSIAGLTRLIDMGILPFMLASALNGIVVQKLARKICAMCVEEAPLSKNILQGHSHFKGRGCRLCGQSGIKGRMGIHEVLVITQELRELIHKNAGESLFFQQARKEGLKTIQDDAVKKVLDGQITYDEAVKISLEV